MSARWLSAMAGFLMVVILLSLPVQAQYLPVLRDEVPGWVKKRSPRLYVSRPCKVATVEGGERSRLVPGDVLRFRRLLVLHNRPVTDRIIAIHKGGVELRVPIKCLSRGRLDYSFRKGSFEAFYGGLARDVPRLVERIVAISEKHNHKVPVTDPKTRRLSTDWQRLQAFKKQLQWIRGQFFYLGYSGRSERSVLKKEADWISGRSEAFIQGFSGDAPPEVKQKLKKIYLLMNQASNVTSFCGRIRRLQQEVDQYKEREEYKTLSPKHRARLESQDLAQVHVKLAKWRTKLATSLAEVRAGMVAQGVKVR